jgi:hypothetical protein
LTPARIRRATLFLAVAGLLLGTTDGATALQQRPRVYPIYATLDGRSYAQWSAEWWKWAVEAPVPTNPVLDETGAHCGVDQPNRVWFLAGTFTGTAVRHCTVPYDRYLFFPVLNTTFIATEPHETEAFVHARVTADIDAVDPSTLFATVDGYPIPNLASYRAHSPTFFLDLPPDNLLGGPPGVYGPAASDGYWLMLVPSRPGPHTVRFGGQFPDGSTVDVTYHLNLVV